MRLSFATLPCLFALSLVACGSDKDKGQPSANTQETGSSADGNGTASQAATGNSQASNQVLTNYASSSKMAQQSTASADEQSDMSETATTGEDDDSGAATAPKAPGSGPGAAFGFSANGKAGWGNSPSAPMDEFTASMSFRGNKHGNAMLSGNVNAMVAPTPHPMGSMADAVNANLTMTLVMDFNRTLGNGETITVVTEPNVVVTKSGRRDHGVGTVTRTLNGTVHRTLSGAKDGNDNFDLTITHNGTTVVDAYMGNRLSTRTTSGTTTVVNNISKETAVTTFNQLVRGKPSDCQCPTGGSVEVKVTAQDGTVSDHTYTFAGTCGAANVDVHADVSAAAAANAAAMASNGNGIAGNANATVSSAAHLSGQLTWANCAIGAN